MGNNNEHHRPDPVFVRDISRYFNSNVEPFHPRLARSDTNTAQAGSPPRSLDEQQPLTKKEDPDTSHSSANSSFPISESALPTTFDTSADHLPPAELSHFFPRPPTTIDASGSQESFATASDCPSNSSLHRSPMFHESKDPQSLQETLDSLWAPAKPVTVRFSAPPTPIVGHTEMLIDFSEPAPAMISSTTSANTSFEVKTGSGGFPSANQSDTDMKPDLPRTETLTQLLASHPELDFGPLESSPKRALFNNIVNQSGSITGILLAGDNEPIQLPPVTYADATNIACQYPELADKVLKEPLATPVQVNRLLEPDDEAEGYFSGAPQQAPEASMEPEPVMPTHTDDSPNWALAPAQPEDYLPRPFGARARTDYGKTSGYRGGGGYERRQSTGGSGGTRYQQDQNEFDSQWGYGGGSGGGDRSRGGDDRRGGGGGPTRSSSGRYPEQGGRGDEQDDYNARNGPQRRGWSQDPSFGGGNGGHDELPHMHRGGGGGGNDSYSHGDRGGDDSYSGGGGNQRLPIRPSATQMDSWNASARDEPAPAPASGGGGGGGDEWSGTERDAWAAAPAEPVQAVWATPVAPTVEEKRDAPASGDGCNSTSAPAGAPAQDKPQSEAVIEWEPTHDPWTAPVTQATPARSASHAPSLPPQQSQSLRREAATAAPPSANEWMANHDPWTSGGDKNQNYNQQQSQKQLEPEKKREAPSSIRGGPSPFRDRVNDNQTPNRSSNEGSFSANLLDVRAPSQANVAALAASRANAHSAAPTELPVEFNYFLHSETVDWMSSGPTNPSQNSFSPSQNLVTPTRELTPTSRTPEQSPAREISAPSPRGTDYFDYKHGGDNWGGASGGVQGKENRSADGTSASGGDLNWGATDGGAQENSPRAEGHSFVLGSMKSDRYGCYSQQDYQRGPSERQWGPSGGDNRGSDSRREGGRSSGYDARGDRDNRDFDNGRGDGGYGGRAGDGYGGDSRGFDGRRGGRGGDHRDGRRNDYNRRDSGHRGDFDNGNPQNLNPYGGAGPLPGPYKGPPRVTSYGAKNFELPPLDSY
ncbi:hypothetical protein DFH08DRAFT_982728 [Mycena albidolilacea]|uniref:Uncharacterized protein n=1 Tax=Mycena albidolilacea TaxID=1033008 RepID=A0AAD7F4H6_9AGAR|nr:hypothetical protein DFH08DRAFT_982728 [Mycena albidolilacea]